MSAYVLRSLKKKFIKEPSMKNYIWAWRDERSISLNEAETLEQIVEEIIACYLEENAEVEVHSCGEYLLVQVVCDEFEIGTVIKNDIPCVINFLGILTTRFDREDQFEIMENAN
jgi:hypothetical protein